MLYDRAEIKGSARITRDGYLVADALVARANNIQTYRASELGLTDRDPNDTVRIFRPESEVFAKDALASLAHRPITIDHPSEAVTSDNWRKLGIGDIGGDVMRDGEFIRVPIKIMDSSAVDAIAGDHREFSLGYAITLDMTPGEHEGRAYDGIARAFRYNHLAAVRAARGGSQLRIIDERPTKEKDVATITLDGLKVDLSDAEAVKAAIAKLETKVNDAEGKLAAAETQVVALTTDKATLEVKVTTLEKQVADSALTPAKLRDAAKAYAGVVAKAKALGVDVKDDMDEPAIQKAVVSAKLGDAAKDWTAEHIAVSFATLTADVKADDSATIFPIHTPKAVNDAEKAVADAYAEMIKDMTSASKPKAA